MAMETQTKAIYGAAAALLASFAPILIASISGGDYTPGEFEQFSDAVKTVGGALIGFLVGWLGVYYAPRNKPR